MGIFRFLAAFPFPVFPVRIDPHPSIPGKFVKRPLTRRGHLDRKAGPEWTEAEWPAEANGIAFCPADRGWVCVDPDHGHDEAWAAANLPATRTHQTPSGAFHLFYECPEKFGNHKLAPCIDIRGSEGWVPLPDVSEGYSTWDAGPVMPLPDPIRKRLVDASAPREKLPAPDGLVETDDPVLVAEARDIIASHIRLYGIGNDPRGDRAYALANLVGDKRNGENILSREKIADLMMEQGYGEIAGDILDRRKVGDRGIEQITFDPPEPTGDLATKFSRLPGIEDARYSGQWWIKRDIPPRQQLIGPISVGARVMISGSTSAGKTMLGLSIGTAVVTGTPLFSDGRWAVPEARRVLIIDAEMSAGQLQERLREILGDRDQEHRLRVLSRLTDFPEAPPLNRPGGWEWLQAQIDLYQPGLILLDNVQSLLAGDLLDLNEWRIIQQKMVGLTRQGITQIWFHHLNASGVGYGGEAREWQMDLGIKLTKAGEGLCADLAYSKRREQETADHAPGRIKRERGAWHFRSRDQVELDTVEDALIRASCELTAKELADRMGIKEKELRAIRGIERYILDASARTVFKMP